MNLKNRLNKIPAVALIALSLCSASCHQPRSAIQDLVAQFYAAVEARDGEALRRVLKAREAASFEHEGVVYRKGVFISKVVDGSLILDEDFDFPDYETRTGFTAQLKVQVTNRRTGTRKVRLFHLSFDLDRWGILRVDELRTAP